jgi:hypothetical protein
MQHNMGIVVVGDINTLKKADGTIFLLPSRLRLIRSALGDNGFSGVRTVTNMMVFQREMMMDAEHNKDTVMPDKETIDDPKKINEFFGGLKEGEYMTVSPKGTLKYLVCNPSHRWALVRGPEAILLCPVSNKKAGTALKGTAIIEANGMASFF